MIKPGDVLEGRYRVKRHLANGGFGQTFEVDDRGRRKVLKVLNLDAFYDPEYKQKAVSLFKQEAEVLSKLAHRGIPRVEPDGYFTFQPLGCYKPYHCLVMDYIDGSNLAEWLQQNQPISQELAIDWLKQLVEILDVVHKQNFFHRDIKPSNIMLKPNGQLVLIDFGAVRQITASYLVQIGLENQGTQIISPGYTPKEQYEGKAVPQSDFFALGRTFVHLLTGKQPLHFPDDSQTGELIWRDCATQISPPLADLIDELIAFLPGRRPQNTKIILQRLESVEIAVKNKLSAISPNPTQQQTTDDSIDFSQIIPRKLRFSLAASLVLGFSGLWVASPQIASFLNQIGYDRYLDGKVTTAEFFFRAAILFNPSLGMAHYNLGSACEDQKNFACAYTQYQVPIQGENNDAASRALNNLGLLYTKRDKKYEPAINLFLQGLKRVEKVEVKSALHKNLGLAYLKLGRYTEAVTNLKESINLEGDRDDAYCLLADSLEKLGEKQGAIAASEKCLSYAQLK
jgi:serine/threonine protein kinase